VNGMTLTFFIIKFFIRKYSLYGGFIVTILIKLILYIGYITPSSLPISPLPTPLKAIARGLFCFIWVDEVHLTCSITLISFIHPPSH
jgi:hypothetical protein